LQPAFSGVLRSKVAWLKPQAPCITHLWCNVAGEVFMSKLQRYAVNLVPGMGC
jgi:hypothetical protein